MISVKSFVFNDFSENTYILFDESKECVIIDPGCYRAYEQQELTEFIMASGLKPVKLLNTHCHIDHVLGNNFVAGKYNLALYMHEKELFTYRDVARWSAMFNVKADEMPENRIYIDEKDRITFGTSTLDIAFTPGHSVASLTFYNLQEKLAIAGDVLFAESIGRTDLPGGDYETLIRSIQTKLMPWDDDVRVYPGHGPATTIGHERKYNPFLNG